MQYGGTSRFFLALAVSLGLAVVTHAQQIPVLVFAGQSNMVGYATDSTTLTVDQTQAISLQPDRRLWAGQQSQPVSWVNMPAATQVNTPDPGASDVRANPIASGHGFGPELAAALTISNGQFAKTVGAVKYAVNSTGLRADGSDLDWSPSTGELYSSMITRAKTSVTALPTSGVSAFFWMQGERDATDLDRADVYQQNLINLINTVRGGGASGFGNANLPIIIGQIDNNPAFGQYTDTIRRAEANVARILNNVYLVPTSDLQHASPPVPFGNQHLTTQGTWDLGVRMGHAYLDSLSPLPARPASMNLAVNGGFEDYAVSKWMGISGSFGSGVTTSPTAMNGWSAVNRGATLTNVAVQSDWGGGAAVPSEGSQFLSLENGVFNPGGAGGISQTISTVSSGATNRRFYNVFFDYSALARGTGETSQFTYDIGGAATPVSVDTTGVSQFHMAAWQTRAFTFTAGSSTTTLRFLPQDTPDGSFFGASIDNVKIIQGPVWTGAGGNTNWKNNGNWNSGTNPDDSDLTNANFLWTTANTTVNLDGGRSVKSLRFDSPNSYTINGTNVLDLRSGSGNTSVIVASGNHTINPRINFNTSMDVDIADNSTLTMNGTFTNNSTSTSALSKFGGGSLVLGNINNTYNGATKVVAGTLRLGNLGTTNNIALSPSITVYRGAVLDTRGLSGAGITLAANQDLFGSGTVRGGVNATASGVDIAPGSSPGILTFDGAGAITLGPSTVLDMEVGGTGLQTGEAGYTFDQIVVSGSGKTFITGGARLNLIALAGRAHLQPYTIVSATNGANINFSGLLKDLDETLSNGVSATENGMTYHLDYSSTAIVVTFTPEPSALALISLSVVGLLRRRVK